MSVSKFVLKFNEDDFTIGDLEDFEEVAGISFVEALKQVPVKDDDGNPVFDDKGRPVKTVDLSPRSLKALVWVVKRREVPGFTVEDARNVRVAALEIENGETNPKETTV